MTGLGIFGSIGNIVSNGISLIEKASQVSQSAIFNPVNTVVGLTSALGSKLGIFNQQAVQPTVVGTGGSSNNLVVPINSSGLGIMGKIKNISSVGSLAGSAVNVNANGTVSTANPGAKKVAGSDYVNSQQMASTTDTASSMNWLLYAGAAIVGAKLLGIKIPFLKL